MNDDLDPIELPDETDVETTEDLPEEQDDEQNPVDDALGFSFDDDSKDPFAGQEAPEWVKQMRRENREMKRQLKEREQAQAVPVLRDKPTLHDFDYDSEAYEANLEQWYQEKAEHDEAVKAGEAQYQHYHSRYVDSVDNMRRLARDYDEVEDSIVDSLNIAKQGLIKTLADDPARLVYTLGKSPNKLAQLASLDDIQFAKQIVLLEQQMTSKSRNPNKPQPKSHDLKGGAGGGDSTLAKLEADAERTGDRSKVIAYRKKMKK